MARPRGDQASGDLRSGLPDLKVRVLEGHKVESGAGKSRRQVDYDDEKTITLPAGEALALVALGSVRIEGTAD